MRGDPHERAAARLIAARSGLGFGPRPGLPPEPEPTALAAIALDDADARRWLAENQRSDGGFALVAGDVVSDSATALAALALPPGDARERAVDHVLSHRAEPLPANPAAPHTPGAGGGRRTRSGGWSPRPAPSWPSMSFGRRRTQPSGTAWLS